MLRDEQNKWDKATMNLKRLYARKVWRVPKCAMQL